jgi:hypothetical protein
VAAPINVGTADQVKDGGLGVNYLAVFGNALLGGLSGITAYLNFGTTAGSGGYGVRDNAGTIEFKNSGGSWASMQSTVSSLVNTNNPSFTTSVTSPQYCIGERVVTSIQNDSGPSIRLAPPVVAG